MIPFDYITEWRARAPWIKDTQVEQDLIISRAVSWDIETAARYVLEELAPRLPGDPWKGLGKTA